MLKLIGLALLVPAIAYVIPWDTSYGNSGTTHAINQTINASTVVNTGTIWAMRSATITATKKLDNSHGLITASTLTIDAANIQNAKDPALGTVCWTTSFILNHEKILSHDPSC